MTDLHYDRYGKHDAWNVNCSDVDYGFDFGDWDPEKEGPRKPPEGYISGHRRGAVKEWWTGMVIWNFATGLFDRVQVRDLLNPEPGWYRVMSYPLDVSEDEETEWR